MKRSTSFISQFYNKKQFQISLHINKGIHNFTIYFWTSKDAYGYCAHTHGLIIDYKQENLKSGNHLNNKMSIT